MQQIVINGNNIDVLKTYPDNYFDSVVTDAPYGLGKEPIAEALMKDWIEKGYHEVSGSGFMGKEWDAFVPQPIFWKEVFRVLKYGGHCLSFYGSRTYDWGVMAMRFAGFEVRDTITWHFGSGFPKSHNISKAIDKMYGAEREVIGKSNYSMPKADNSMSENSYGISGGKLANGNTAERVVADITAPSTDKAKEWEGWGSALKPASEYIVMARKPLEKGLSIAENVLKWGTGAINIDGCRVSTNETWTNVAQDIRGLNGLMANKGNHPTLIKESNPQGRFPANLILTHHPECECVGTKKVKSDAHHTTKYNGNETLYKGGWKDGEDMGNKFADENGEETIEDWNCHEDCPIKILDEQSGESKSQRSERGNIVDNNVFGKYNPQENTTRGHNDKGGASRFFLNTSFEEDFVRFQYQAKASKSERNKGLEGFEEGQTKGGGGTYNEEAGAKYGSIKAKAQNFHPTVKPIKLMQYLVRLVTPPNGIVLDPFVGSGTTGIACKLEGFQFVGIEQDAEYCKIAQARIENYVEEIQKPTKRKVETDECVTDEIINTTQLGLF